MRAQGRLSLGARRFRVTLALEQGLASVEAVNWYGILVAAMTPAAVSARPNEGWLKTLGNPSVREKRNPHAGFPWTQFRAGVSSTQHQARFLDELAPLGDLGLDVGAELLGAAADRRRSVRSETLHDLR